MRPSTVVSLFAAFSLVSVTKATNAPDKMVLLSPPTGADITTGEKVFLGVDNSQERVLGVLRDVNILIYHPNGTEWGLKRYEDRCDDGGMGKFAHEPAATYGFQPDQPGPYKVTWEITFSQSADVSKANETYCGPGPFSTERWNLTREFQVKSSPATPRTQVDPTPIFTTLPSEPTSKGQGADSVNAIKDNGARASDTGLGLNLAVLLSAAVGAIYVVL